MLFSVMIPVYRPSENYLQIALESVLMQDLGSARMQIEVVDDCSPGVDVRRMVSSISGDRVKYSKTPRNLGLTGCWNTCIDRARGEWVHLFHQDDLVLNGFYRALEKAFNSSASIGAAFCRHAICDGNGHWLELSRLHRREAGIIPDFGAIIGEGQHIQTPSIVVRRSTYEKIGNYQSDLAYTLDWEMFQRIAANFDIWYEPQILAVWRKHVVSETARLAGNGKLGADYLKVFSLTKEYYKKYPQLLRISKEEHSKVVALEAKKLLVAGKMLEAFQEMRVSFQLGQTKAKYSRLIEFYSLLLRIYLSKTKKTLCE
jgi:glycosyltransferase involved in cell wall biosynthesis